MGYDFKNKYQLTNDFGQADTLSGLIGSQVKREEYTLAAISTKTEVHLELLSACYFQNYQRG